MQSDPNQTHVKSKLEVIIKIEEVFNGWDSAPNNIPMKHLAGWVHILKMGIALIKQRVHQVFLMRFHSCCVGDDKALSAVASFCQPRSARCLVCLLLMPKLRIFFDTVCEKPYSCRFASNQQTRCGEAYHETNPFQLFAEHQFLLNTRAHMDLSCATVINPNCSSAQMSDLKTRTTLRDEAAVPKS